METNDELVDYLIDSGALRTREIIEALREIDRQDFVPPDYQDQSYSDYPLPIGKGQTISQPTTVAIMLELLQAGRGDKVLDVGSGSGWTTALLAEIVGKTGHVVGAEIIPELLEFGKENLNKYSLKNAHIVLAGQELGLPAEAPFERILVSASGTKEPTGLLAQLKIKGKIVVPIESSIWQIDRISKTGFKRSEYPGFAFVSLTE